MIIPIVPPAYFLSQSAGRSRPTPLANGLASSIGKFRRSKQARSKTIKKKMDTRTKSRGQDKQ